MESIEMLTKCWSLLWYLLFSVIRIVFMFGIFFFVEKNRSSTNRLHSKAKPKIQKLQQIYMDKSAMPQLLLRI